jgi:hypothetical protein
MAGRSTPGGSIVHAPARAKRRCRSRVGSSAFPRRRPTRRLDTLFPDSRARERSRRGFGDTSSRSSCTRDLISHVFRVRSSEHRTSLRGRRSGASPVEDGTPTNARRSRPSYEQWNRGPSNDRRYAAGETGQLHSPVRRPGGGAARRHGLGLSFHAKFTRIASARRQRNVLEGDARPVDHHRAVRRSQTPSRRPLPRDGRCSRARRFHDGSFPISQGSWTSRGMTSSTPMVGSIIGSSPQGTPASPSPLAPQQ